MMKTTHDHTLHLHACLSPVAQAMACEYVAETGSTNSDLMARLATLNQPTLRVAGRQTAGRGRAGRRWVSGGEADSLCFSLAWPFTRALKDMAGLPLAVGVMLAQTLVREGVAVRLKWPNDLLVDGQKFGGILVETRQLDPACWAVVGIGLNLGERGEIEHKIGHAVGSMAARTALDRTALLAAVTDALCAGCVDFDRSGLVDFVAPWNAFDAFAGERVCILDHGQVLHEGIAQGIDDQGRFMVEEQSGQRVAILAGDVSLRLPMGVPACNC